jgi:putative hemolysin
VAGYVVAALGRLPDRGDVIEVDGHSLEVVALDGRRVARLRLTAEVHAAEGADQPDQEPTRPAPDRLTE